MRFWARTRGRKHFKTRSAKWRILSKRFHSLLCSCHIFSKVSLQIKPKPISSLSIQNTQLFGNQWPLGKIETKHFKRDRSIIVEECHLLLVTTRITKKFQRLHRVLTIPLAASPFTDKFAHRAKTKSLATDTKYFEKKIVREWILFYKPRYVSKSRCTHLLRLYQESSLNRSNAF